MGGGGGEGGGGGGGGGDGKTTKGGRAEGFPSSHPALPAYPAYPAFYPLPNYQIKRNPMRPVRGPRIAVGCWKFAPARVLIVSAAYAFVRLNPSRNRRTLATSPSFTVFSTRRSITEIVSCRYALYGVAKMSVAERLPLVPFATLPRLPAAALNAQRHDAGADTETRRA